MAIGVNNQDELFKKLVKVIGAQKGVKPVATYTQTRRQPANNNSNNSSQGTTPTTLPNWGTSFDDIINSGSSGSSGSYQNTDLSTLDFQSAQRAVGDAASKAQQSGVSPTDIDDLASGKSLTSRGLGALGAVLNFAPVKTALFPFLALDPGRRGVISASREFVDKIDTDPTTKANWDDWLKQTKDPLYGGGTAFPTPGWLGRFKGLAIDLVADPVNWATFGSAIPVNASVRVASSATQAITKQAGVAAVRAIEKDVARTSLRGALGAKPRVLTKVFGNYKPVRINTLETRVNLAGVVRGQMESINLLSDAELLAINATKKTGEQLIKRTKEQMDLIEKAIIKSGKARGAIPVDIARDIGIPKSGVYYAGSRIKVPFSGGVAKVLEDTLSATRSAIQGSNRVRLANITSKMITQPTDAPVNVKELKKSLLTGRDAATKELLTPEQISRARITLQDATESRVARNQALEVYNNVVRKQIENNPALIEHKDYIYKIIDKSDALRAAAESTATPGQKAAVAAFEKILDDAFDQIVIRMKSIDPDFDANKVKNYFPHQMTQNALDYVDNVNNNFVAELRAFIKNDVSNPTSAFNSRALVKGRPFFGHILTEEDLGKGIDRLNELAILGGFKGGNFFETDAIKVLQRYGQSYAGEFATAHFLERQFQNGMLAHLVSKGEYDTETLEFLVQKVKQETANVTSKAGDVSKTAKIAISYVEDALDNLLEGKTGRGGLRKQVLDTKGKLKTQTAAVKTTEKDLNKIINSIENMIDNLIDVGLVDAQQIWENQGLKGLLVATQINEPLQRLVTQIEFIKTEADRFRDMITMGTVNLDQLRNRLLPLRKQLKKLEKDSQKLKTRLQTFDAVQNHLGEFINGRFSANAAENLLDTKEKNIAAALSREGFGSDAEYKAAQRILELLENQSLRDKVGLTSGGRLTPSFKSLWTKTDNEEVISKAEKQQQKLANKFVSGELVLPMYERMPTNNKPVRFATIKDFFDITKANAKIAAAKKRAAAARDSEAIQVVSREDVRIFQSILDPKGRVSQNQLASMTITEVRQIMNNSAATASSLADIHRAMIWLTLRDANINPSLINDVISANALGDAVTPGFSGLIDNSGSVMRVKKLQTLINDINNDQEIIEIAGSISGAAKKMATDDRRYLSLPEVIQWNNQIADLDQQIIEQSKHIAKLEDSPGSALVRDLEAYSRGQVDTPIINQAHIDSILRQVDEIPVIGGGGADAALNSEIFIRAGINRGGLTYAQVMDGVDEIIAQIPGQVINIRQMNRKLTQFAAAKTELQNLKNKRNKLVETMQTFKAGRDAKESIQLAKTAGAGSYLEKVMDYSNQALEYYLYAETKFQFNNMMDNLSPFGLTPDQGIWKRISSDVASSHLARTKVLEHEFEAASAILKNIASELQNIPASEQGTAFREILQGIFKTEQYSIDTRLEVGELLDRVYPELRPSVSNRGLSDMSRRQANDEQLISIRDNLLDMLRNGFKMEDDTLVSLKTGGQARTRQRAGYFAGAGDDAVPSVGVPAAGESMVTKYGTPAAGKQQLDINVLIQKIGGEGIRYGNTFRFAKGVDTVVETNVATGTRANANMNMMQSIKIIRDWVSKNATLSESQGVRFNQLLDDAEAQAGARIQQLRNQAQFEKQQRISAGLKGSVRAASKEKQAAKQLAQETNYNYGLSGKLNLALESSSRQPVRDFFSEMFGGKVKNYSSNLEKWTNTRLEKGVLVDIIEEENSYYGTMQAKLAQRKTALRALMDPDYPVDVLSGMDTVAPGLTGGDPLSVLGRQGYADALAERAIQIRQAILANKEFAATVLRLEKEAMSLFESGVEQRQWVLEILSAESKKSTASDIFRYANPDININTTNAPLSKKVKALIAEAQVLELRVRELSNSGSYVIASHEETLKDFLIELSRLQMHNVVDLQGKNGIFFESSGTKQKYNRIWNAEGSRNTKSISNFIRQQPPNSPYYRGTEARFAVHKMTEVPYDKSLNTEGLKDFVRHEYYVNRDGVLTNIKSLDAADKFDLSELVVMRYDAPPNNRALDADALINHYRTKSEVLSGSKFNPEKSYVIFHYESSIMGQAKTASENMVVVPAKPATLVPLTQIGSFENTPIVSHAFTETEWNALFDSSNKVVKGKEAYLKQEIKRLDNLRASIAKQESTTTSRNEKLILRDKFAKADRAFQRAEKELATYQGYQSGMRKLNDLLREFENPLNAARLGVPEAHAGDAVYTARTWVNSQLDGYGAMSDAQSQSLGLGTNPIGASQKVYNKRVEKLLSDWQNNPTKSIIDEMNYLQSQKNEIAFAQWSDNVSEQYSTYTQTLDELDMTRGFWVNDEVITASRDISKIIDSKVVSDTLGKKASATSEKVAKNLAPLEESTAQAKNLLSEENKYLADQTSFDKPAPPAMPGSATVDPLELIKQGNKDAEGLARTAEQTAAQLRAAPVEDAVSRSANADALRGNIVDELAVAKQKENVIAAQIAELDWYTLLQTQDISMLKQIIDNMTPNERRLLQAKAKAMDEVAKMDAKRLRIIMRPAELAGMKRGTPVERLVKLAEAKTMAEASFDQSKHAKSLTEKSLKKTQKTIDTITEILENAPKSKSLTVGKVDPVTGMLNVDTWLPEVKEWLESTIPVLEKLSKDKTIAPKTAQFMNALIDAESALMLARITLGDASADLAYEKGFKAIFDATGVNRGAQIIVRSMQDGYEMLDKDRFPNVTVDSAYAEIMRNAQAFKDPNVLSGIQRLLKQWNARWKPLATGTPGFHVRNGLQNITAQIFGGAKIEYMIEGGDIVAKWMQASKNNVTWEDFVLKLPIEQQYYARGANWASAASGGGAFNDVVQGDNAVQRMWIINKSRQFGMKSDDFSRFQFSYDAMRQGFSPEQAGLRTKRFFFDYTDVSTLDENMRQIVPFWMWTSRNTVTQLQNMWMNPRAFAKYESFKRNFSGKDDEGVPRGWVELGAMKLPFGKDLYVLPDIGYNRIGQQFEMLKNPSRFLADLNPAVRVPAELAFNKQLYQGRPINDGMAQQVSGFGPASLVQPIARVMGFGENNAQGDRFIDPRFTYAAANLFPPFGTANRVIPSDTGNSASNAKNSLLGFLGSPVKELKPEAQRSEMLRRLYEINNRTKYTKSLTGE